MSVKIIVAGQHISTSVPVAMKSSLGEALSKLNVNAMKFPQELTTYVEPGYISQYTQTSYPPGEYTFSSMDDGISFVVSIIDLTTTPSTNKDFSTNTTAQVDEILQLPIMKNTGVVIRAISNVWENGQSPRRVRNLVESGNQIIFDFGEMNIPIGIPVGDGISIRINAFGCNTKMVLHSESLLLNVIPKWYYLQNPCFWM